MKGGVISMFGKNITEYRKQMGYTQAELSKMLDVNPGAVSQWEKDLTQPQIDTLVKMSKILCISLEELIGAEKSEPGIVLSPDERNLILSFRAADNGDKKAIMKILGIYKNSMVEKIG